MRIGEPLNLLKHHLRIRGVFIVFMVIFATYFFIGAAKDVFDATFFQIGLILQFVGNASLYYVVVFWKCPNCGANFHNPTWFISILFDSKCTNCEFPKIKESNNKIEN